MAVRGLAPRQGCSTLDGQQLVPGRPQPPAAVSSSARGVLQEGEALPEGAVVTILVREAEETFEVPPELEAEFLEPIAEADRGETISAEELIERLRRIA